MPMLFSIQFSVEVNYLNKLTNSLQSRFHRNFGSVNVFLVSPKRLGASPDPEYGHRSISLESCKHSHGRFLPIRKVTYQRCTRQPQVTQLFRQKNGQCTYKNDFLVLLKFYAKVRPIR